MLRSVSLRRSTDIRPDRPAGKACLRALEISSLTINPQGIAALMGTETSPVSISSVIRPGSVA